MWQLLVLIVGACSVMAMEYQGINYPWDHCGCDYGCGQQNASKIESQFKEFHQVGSNIVRMWVFFNGDQYRTPVWDANGLFQPLSDGFFSDMKNMLDIASAQQQKVIVTWWSFECGDEANCRNMIESETGKQAFITNGVVPMVKAFGDHPALHSWEVFNEPEWMIIEEAARGVVTNERTVLGGCNCVKLADVQSFSAAVATAVHSTSKKNKISVGSASWKFNAEPSANCPRCVGNWWANLGMDFYQVSIPRSLVPYITTAQVHFYPWMVEGGNDFGTRPSGWFVWAHCLCVDCFSQGYGPQHYLPDIGSVPVLIGEASGKTIVIKGKTWTPCELYQAAAANGYDGCLLWSANGTEGAGYLTDIEDGLQCYAATTTSSTP